MNATLRLRKDELAKYRVRAELGTEQALAEAMGADRGTVNRVLNSKAKPGPDFVASLVSALGGEVTLNDLFEIVPDDSEGPA